MLLVADGIGGVCQYSLELSASLAAHGVQVALAVAGPEPTSAQRAEAEAIPGLRLQLLEVRLDWPAHTAAGWRLPPARKG
jgi:glycogen synthase